MNIQIGLSALFLAALFTHNAFGAEATTGDKFAQVRGFQVEISRGDGRPDVLAFQDLEAGDIVTEVSTREQGSGQATGRRQRYMEITLSGGGEVEREWAIQTAREQGSGLATGRRMHIKPKIVSFDPKQDEVANKDMPTFEFSSCKMSQAEAGLNPMGRNSQTKVVVRCSLQEATQMESRKYQTLSNASKARHDIALNAIRNMK